MLTQKKRGRPAKAASPAVTTAVLSDPPTIMPLPKLKRKKPAVAASAVVDSGDDDDSDHDAAAAAAPSAPRSVAILCTGLAEHPEWKSMVEALGGRFVDAARDATHVVAPKVILVCFD